MQNNKFYDYPLLYREYDGNVEYHSLQLRGVFLINIPEQFVSYPSYPNPFNPVANIRFGITEYGFVILKVLTVFGQDIITLEVGCKDVGYHKDQWQGKDRYGIPVSSRANFSVFQDGHQVQVVKMILMQ
tara:strand:+ start:344 stop:730 length:387 start_codon:yes stop_codon:yes gene_type:complete